MDVRPRRPLPVASIAVLVVGPLLMVLGRLLAVPFDDQDWDRVLTRAAGNPGRSDTGWLLAVAASGLLGASAGTLAHLLRAAGRPVAAAVAAVGTALGWAGAAGICVAGLIFSAMGASPQRAAQVQVLKDLNAGSTQYVFLLCVIGAVGHVVLAVGLSRSGVVGRTGATLLGLGGAGSLLCVPGPVSAMACAFALLLLAGHVLVVRALGSAPTATRPPAWEQVPA